MQGSENVVKGTELSPQNILRTSSLTPVTLNTGCRNPCGVCVCVGGGGFSVALQVSDCLGGPTMSARSPWAVLHRSLFNALALTMWIDSRELP